jgi:hypothetical protein
VSAHPFDTWTRHAITVSRRASLTSLGGAALAAALSVTPEVNAAKNSKKAKRKLKKKCAAQAGQCQATVQTFCAGIMDPAQQQECVQVLSPCCALITGCDVSRGISCILTAATT